MLWGIEPYLRRKFDCPSMVVFFTMRTAFATVHSIQFQILDLDFAIQYWKGKVLFIFIIFGGRKLEERK